MATTIKIDYLVKILRNTPSFGRLNICLPKDGVFVQCLSEKTAPSSEGAVVYCVPV